MCNINEEVIVVDHHISDVGNCGRNGRLKLAQAVGLGSGLRFRLKFRLIQLYQIIVYCSCLVVLIVFKLNRGVLVNIPSYCVLVRLPGC